MTIEVCGGPEGLVFRDAEAIRHPYWAKEDDGVVVQEDHVLVELVGGRRHFLEIGFWRGGKARELLYDFTVGGVLEGHEEVEVIGTEQRCRIGL